MGDLRIVRLTNVDPDFYPTLGPFLARRDIVAAFRTAIAWPDSVHWS